MLSTNNLNAEESKKVVELDEEFLAFLADTSIKNGQIFDPLDMLEISNEQLVSSTKTKKKNDAEKKIVKKKVEPKNMEKENKQ